MQMQFRPATKSAMQWGGSGAYGGGWGRFEKLTDPWPRSKPEDWQTGTARFNSITATCIAWMQRTAPEPTLRVWTRKGDEVVDDHPLSDLFRQPNKFYCSSRLIQCLLSDWVLAGNAYIRKERSNGGDIIALHYLPECQVEPDWPKGPKSSVYISHYNYKVGGEVEPIPVDDVIHLRFGQDPENARKGWSPLRAGIRELAVLNTGADYRAYLLENMGTPPYVAQPKDQMRVVTEEIANILRAGWQKLTGGRNRGTLMVPSVPMDFERIGFSPEELDIVGMLGWDTEVICSLIGLSAMVVSLPSNSKTYSNYGQALEAAWNNCLIPTLRLWAEELDVQLLDDMGDPQAQYVAWDASKVQALQEDEHKKWMRVIQAKKEGILSVNEARDRIDTTLPELPEPKEEAADVDDLSKRANVAGILVRSGYDPAGALVAAGLDPVAHLGLLPVTLQPEDEPEPKQPPPGQQPMPANLNGRGITEERFKSLAGVWGEG